MVAQVGDNSLLRDGDQFVVKFFAIIGTSLILVFVLAEAVILSSPQVSSAAFHYMVHFRNQYTVKNKVVTGHDGWLFFEPDLEYILDSLPPENIDRICEFDRKLRDHGIALFVLPIPSKIEIYPEKFTRIPAPRPMKVGREELIEQLRGSGVRVIDIVPRFTEARESCQVFDGNDSHWTPMGIELAAQIIGREIDSALIARRILCTARYTVRDTQFMARGDVLGKYTGVEKRAWYPVPVDVVYDSLGQPYQDDRKSKVMILGDSFVDRGSWWHAHLGAHLARTIGYPTRTLFSLQANYRGPCMYDLKPRSFPRRGIVVWAFTSRILRTRLCDPDQVAAAAM